MAPPHDSRRSPVTIPDSYTNLPYKDIKISHHPASSPTPTPVLILTLNRPSQHNAFTGTMIYELEEVFGKIDADDRVKCVVVTGSGRIFCAGADLSPDHGFQRQGEKTNDHRDGGGRVTLAIHHCKKPIIGALQGSAVGVGITMTLPMAIRVAYRGAKIGFVFARRGLVMEACSSYFLPRLIGFSRALHLTTTGATYRADDKLLDSLFSTLCDKPEDVLPTALSIAEDVAANTSVVSTYLMRELMYRDTGSAEGQHLLDSRILHSLFESRDNAEGVQSFLEKRPSNFQGTVEQDAPDAYPWWVPVDVIPATKAANKSKL